MDRASWSADSCCTLSRGLLLHALTTEGVRMKGLVEPSRKLQATTNQVGDSVVRTVRTMEKKAI
jgi:hypothetical protein